MSGCRRPVAALLLGFAFLVAACAPEAALGPGDRMALPEPGRAAFYVVVERGQSLDHIAQTYRVSTRDVIAANHLVRPYKLVPGSLLEVPLDAPSRTANAKTRSKTHVAAAMASPKRLKMAKAARHAGKRVAKTPPRTKAIVAAKPSAGKASSGTPHPVMAAAPARLPEVPEHKLVPLDDPADNRVRNAF